jgi:hypothetical protein
LSFEEIERMMTELTAPCNKGNFISIARQPAPAAITALPKRSSVRQGTPFQLTEAISELPQECPQPIPLSWSQTFDLQRNDLWNSAASYFVDLIAWTQD